MASTGSPRNKRKTTCFFRLADHRFTSAAVNGGQNSTSDGGVDQRREAGLIFGAAS
jgi:hypothetical protein